MKKILALILSIIMVFSMVGCQSEEQKKNNNGKEENATEAAASSTGASISDANTLKDAFANDFTLGAAVNSGDFYDDDMKKVITTQFNSVTMENEMKPESLLDGPATEASSDKMPKIKTEVLDNVLGGAKANGLKVRGHCLVWYSQTPEWFFAKDYEPSNGLVDKETMKKRMESYIKEVVTYAQSKYPGVVYAWDVVNEAFSDDGGYRMENNKWWEVYGDESYIFDAFKFARKYVDSEEAKLFLNDYNEYVEGKKDDIVETLKKLRKDNLVDGFGMQSHWDMDFPSVMQLQNALTSYGQIEGLEVQLTEIDMHNTDDSKDGFEAQADRYKEFFEAILEADRSGKCNITNVTFWGINDSLTWLTSFKGEVSYPLMLDENNKPKPCFDAIISLAKGK